MRKCYGRDVEKKEIRKSMTKMDNMKKDKHETYESFFSRYTETKDDLERLMKTRINEGQLELYVTEMIKRSDDETKKMFLELRSSQELLEMMRNRMSIRESVIGLTEKTREEDRNDQKERDSLEQMVRTLKIDNERLSERTKTHVCEKYQTEEGCQYEKRTGIECRYTHRKLNKNELKELKETLEKVRVRNKERRHHIDCYKCGKRGHYSRECVSVGPSPTGSGTLLILLSQLLSKGTVVVHKRMLL